MSDPNIQLTESAAKRINAIIARQAGAELLRISVIGGGCSGFSYKFDLETATTDDDFVIERDGARVAIDSASIPFAICPPRPTARIFCMPCFTPRFTNEEDAGCCSCGSTCRCC